MNKSESISKIAPALLKAQRKMGDAVKDAKNPFYKSSYADLNAIREAVIPVLNEHGMSVLQPTISSFDKEYVETIIIHESGEWVSSQTLIVVAKQNDPQGQGSGLSYARRYGLQSMMNVGAVDDDGEKAQGRGPVASSPVAKAAPAASVAAKPAVATNSAAPAPAAKPATTSSFRRGAAASPAKATVTAPTKAEPASAPSVQEGDQGDGWQS